MSASLLGRSRCQARRPGQKPKKRIAGVPYRTPYGRVQLLADPLSPFRVQGFRGRLPGDKSTLPGTPSRGGLTGLLSLDPEAKHGSSREPAAVYLVPLTMMMRSERLPPALLSVICTLLSTAPCKGAPPMRHSYLSPRRRTRGAPYSRAPNRLPRKPDSRGPRIRASRAAAWAREAGEAPQGRGSRAWRLLCRPLARGLEHVPLKPSFPRYASLARSVPSSTL